MHSGGKPLGIAMIGTGMVARTHVLAIRDAAMPLRLAGVMSRHADRAARIRGGCCGTPRPRRVGLRGSFGDMRRRRRGHRPDPDAARRARIPDRAAGAAGKGDPPGKTGGPDLAEAEEVVAICESGRRATGRRVPAPHAGGVAGRARAGAGRHARRVGPCRDFRAVVAGTGLLRRARARHLCARRRRRPDLAGHSHDRPGADADRARWRGAGDDGHQPSARMEAEDVAVSGLRFANGGLGWLTASTASFPGRSESITLHFEKASLHLAEGVLQVHWRDGRTETHGATASTGGGADPMAFTHDWHMGAGGFRERVAEGRLAFDFRPGRFAAHELIHAITTVRGRGASSYTRIWKPMSLRFAVLGIDHRHAFGMTEHLIAAGASCAGWWTEGSTPARREGFVKRFPDLPGCPTGCDPRPLRHRPCRHRGHPTGPRRAGHRGDARRQGRDGRQTRLHHDGAACGPARRAGGDRAHLVHRFFRAVRGALGDPGR
jgi:hypothetical protein